MTYLPFSPIARIANAIDSAKIRSRSRRDYRRMIDCEGYASRSTPPVGDYLSLALFRCRTWR